MKILLVSDESEIIKSISENLFFLRNDDDVIVSTYEMALQNSNLSSSEVVLICEDDDNKKTTNLIKELKKKSNLSLILLCKTENRELILASVDLGVDNYMVMPIEDYEIVLRTVNTIKNNSIKNKDVRNTKLLEQLKVIDETTGLYNYSYSKQVMENVIDLDLLSKGTFMAVAPSNEGKQKFSFEKFAQNVKESTRNSDVVTMGKGTNIYILMPETNMNGAIVILNKINNASNFKICAGISDIEGKSFEVFESNALKALAEAIATEKDYIFAEEKEDATLDDWLDNTGEKGYKIFRQMFNKKLEKVISPVFYRLQKSYEEKLFDTEIYQCVDKDRCEFRLKNKKNSSSLKIIYTGFSKIVISIEHAGLDSPENEEIKLKLDKITEKELIDIIENFIKEFKTRM